MNTEILSADKDPMGAAILDFQQHGKAARLRVLSSMFEEDEMPVKPSVQKHPGNADAGTEGLAACQGTGAGYWSRQRLPYARPAGEGIGR